MEMKLRNWNCYHYITRIIIVELDTNIMKNVQ